MKVSWMPSTGSSTFDSRKGMPGDDCPLPSRLFGRFGDCHCWHARPFGVLAGRAGGCFSDILGHAVDVVDRGSDGRWNADCIGSVDHCDLAGDQCGFGAIALSEKKAERLLKRALSAPFLVF